ncbi:interferon regulatory factor 7 isoform X1 [Pelodiscus sinensis]|uniref:interferon regulatory factor 7 isoform X1 n=1 Tax=Pelodiscus sinensis TaxID=13735 RepID=UPI003F6C9F05
MAASENGGGTQQLRFASWLISQIKSRNYEGLCWVNEAQMKFRIPWKHTSRRDITTNDYKIFKAWAIASGKYNEKVKDLAKWKTNFRCALRSTNKFQLVQDNSKVSEDPHKVYQIISPNSHAGAAANAPTAKSNYAGDNLPDSEENNSPLSKEALPLHCLTPQLLQQKIELDMEILSLENPLKELDSMPNKRPAYDPGRNAPNGYTTDNAAPNGYQCSPDTLQWVLQQCNLTQNSCRQQQPAWTLDGGLDPRSAEEAPYEDSHGYPNHHLGQDGYHQPGSRAANGPVENYHQSVGQWVTQTQAETQPMQNGYDPSAASLLQQPLPHSTVPGISQLLNNAAEALFEGSPRYDNHMDIQSTFLHEAPAGNAVIYQTPNGPGDSGYQQPASQWAAPTVMEQNRFTHPAAPLPEQPIPSPSPAPLQNNTDPFFPHMDVTVYYRGKPLHQVQVATRSCLFTYNNEDPTVVPGCAHVVHFPSPDELPDQKQVRFTRQLLQNIGLLLEQKHKKIYAKRLNKCKVFWALSRQLAILAQNPELKPLPRDMETEIFDYDVFLQELLDFKKQQRAASPDFTIYLCFGQCFSKSKPKETLLILVKLVPKFCEYFYEAVLKEGASSLNSGNLSLQMSSSFNSLYDLLEQYAMQID